MNRVRYGKKPVEKSKAKRLVKKIISDIISSIHSEFIKYDIKIFSDNSKTFP